MVTAWVAALSRASQGRHLPCRCQCGVRVPTDSPWPWHRSRTRPCSRSSAAATPSARRRTGCCTATSGRATCTWSRAARRAHPDRGPRLGVSPGRASPGRPPHLAGQQCRARWTGPTRGPRRPGWRDVRAARDAGRPPREHLARDHRPAAGAIRDRGAGAGPDGRHRRRGWPRGRPPRARTGLAGRGPRRLGRVAGHRPVAVVPSSRGAPVKVLHVLDSFSFGGAEQLVASLGASPAPGSDHVRRQPRAARTSAATPCSRDSRRPASHPSTSGCADWPTRWGWPGWCASCAAATPMWCTRTSGMPPRWCRSQRALPGCPVWRPCTTCRRTSRGPSASRSGCPCGCRPASGRLVLVSHAARHEFARRHGPATPSWRVIHNGVDLARFPEEAGAPGAARPAADLARGGRVAPAQGPPRPARGVGHAGRTPPGRQVADRRRRARARGHPVRRRSGSAWVARSSCSGAATTSPRCSSRSTAWCPPRTPKPCPPRSSRPPRPACRSSRRRSAAPSRSSWTAPPGSSCRRTGPTARRGARPAGGRPRARRRFWAGRASPCRGGLRHAAVGRQPPGPLPRGHRPQTTPTKDHLTSSDPHRIRRRDPSGHPAERSSASSPERGPGWPAPSPWPCWPRSLVLAAGGAFVLTRPPPTRPRWTCS